MPKKARVTPALGSHAQPLSKRRSAASSSTRFRPLHFFLLLIGGVYLLLLHAALKSGLIDACTLLGLGCGIAEESMLPSPSSAVVVMNEMQEQLQQEPPPLLEDMEQEEEEAEEQQQQQDKHTARDNITTSRWAGEKLLYMLTSFDRGQRMANFQGKDKLPIILEVVERGAQLCDFGYDVEMVFISAWPASEEVETKEAIERALYCQRTEAQVPLVFWDHFDQSISGGLAAQHRYIVEEKLQDFDFFIHIEDDMGLLPEQVERYRHHLEYIQANGKEDRATRFLPGFIRYEMVNQTETKALWEGVATEFEVEKVGEEWYAKTPSFSNQAGWMATRAQVQAFNSTCNERFFQPWGDAWVEYWSGGLQLYEQCNKRKVLPLAEFDLFCLYHLSNNKLGHRGGSVTPVEEVKKHLQALKEECIKEGMVDSLRLARRLDPPEVSEETTEEA